MMLLEAWFATRERATAASAFPSEDAHTDEETQSDIAFLAGSARVEASDRIRELEEALTAAHRDVEVQKSAAAQRERVLADEFSGALVARLIDDMRTGLAVIQRALESAICDVLTPFLSGEAGKVAGAKLLELVKASCRNSPEPLVQIRAPRQMHDAFRIAMEEMALSATIVEASSVELDFAARSEHFEELASAWINVIAGAGDEP